MFERFSPAGSLVAAAAVMTLLLAACSGGDDDRTWSEGAGDPENRPEEAQPKILAVREVLQTDDIVWHSIGHIQSRKVKLVVPGFAMVQSVDRTSIAQKLCGLCF